ncbi:forkhead box protein G [Trema orientale]|uniref:Forkhead box protein G n=1 Tax=Trema orientale TaxID=63057 RepID=A0A2P5DS83_TREOI|nr:forkhead box protein G [Trema orientale]
MYPIPVPVPSHNNYLSITNYKLLFPMLRRWPLLIYAASWTTLLTLTVAVVSFSPEVAFVSAISTSSSFSRACHTDDAIRVPLDMPGQIICLPANRFTKSNIDLIVPPVFAALVVAGSAFLVRAAALWEYDAHFNLDG